MLNEWSTAQTRKLFMVNEIEACAFLLKDEHSSCTADSKVMGNE
jgi:hypothetical protein